MRRYSFSSILHLLSSILVFIPTTGAIAQESPARLRVIVETDAGGDPDDEQSLVRFLLYACDWDVEGIIANRPVAIDGENRNAVRDGLGIVRRQLDAYGEVHPKLKLHDARYPTKEALWKVTAPGYDDVDDGVKLVLGAVDKDDPRPVWFMNWGTNKGSGESCLKRALDQVLKERGAETYGIFKRRIRLSSADKKFGDHTWDVGPPFEVFIHPFWPDMDGGRWYWRFSAVTRTAGGFDLKRDVLEGHGPLGKLYPTNTHLVQKEGDSPTFMLLIPNGLNEPEHPEWGSWAGRFGLVEKAAGRRYYEPNVRDTIGGKAHRDNTLSRWAAHLQNDFAARMDWCVSDFAGANHPPVVKVAGERVRKARVGETVRLDASGSTDPDGNRLKVEWVFYPEVSGYTGAIVPTPWNGGELATVTIPADAAGRSLHFIGVVTDDGKPALTRYGRVIVDVER